MKYLFLVFFILTLSFAGSEKVSAHYLLASESTSAVLHVSPDDDPVVGEHSRINFEFVKLESGFSLLACDCEVVIKNQKGELFRVPMVVQSTNRGYVEYVFSKREVYVIQLIAKPKVEGVFREYTLSTDFRVDKENVNAESVTHPHHSDPPLFYALFGLACAYILYSSLRAWKKGEIYFSWH